jgi:hypothetical protein
VKYLLACPQCGSKAPVDGGQAGQLLRCASCGHEFEVPSVRHLRELEPVAADEVPAPTWSSRQGLLFLGTALVAIAIVAGGAIVALRPALPTRDTFTLNIDRDAIKREVSALSPSEAYTRLELIMTMIPHHEEDVAKGGIPEFQIPAGKLLANFEGTGPVPLAPNEMGKLLKEANKLSEKAFAAQDERHSMNDWLWIVGVAAIVGIGLVCTGLASATRKPQRRVATSK